MESQPLVYARLHLEGCMMGSTDCLFWMLLGGRGWVPLKEEPVGFVVLFWFVFMFMFMFVCLAVIYRSA